MATPTPKSEAPLPVQNYSLRPRLARRLTEAAATAASAPFAAHGSDRGDAKRRRCILPPSSSAAAAKPARVSQFSTFSTLRGVDKSNRILHELIALARNDGRNGPLSAAELAAAAKAMVKSLSKRASAHKGGGGSRGGGGGSSSSNVISSSIAGGVGDGGGSRSRSVMISSSNAGGLKALLAGCRVVPSSAATTAYSHHVAHGNIFFRQRA